MAISGLIWSSFGVFLVALQKEFGWSRGEISTAFAIFALANAISAPFLGHVMRIWDSRRIMGALALLLGGTLCGTALFVNGIAGYWLIFGLLGGVGAQCVSSFAVFAILARRIRTRLATSMSIADAGSGLATLLGLPLIQAVIEVHGWRAAYAVLGLLVILLVAAIHLLIFDAVRLDQRRSAHRSEVALSLSRRIRAGQWRLAVMCLAFFFGSASYHGLLTQQIAIFDAEGIAPDRAVWIASFGGGVIFLWRLGSGWLCDVVGVGRVITAATLAVGLTYVGMGFVMTGSQGFALVLYPLALGVGFGGQQVIMATAMRGLSPCADFPVNLGYGRLASGLGMAAGPPAAGLVYDFSGSTLAVVSLLAVASTAHVLTLLVAIIRYGAQLRRLNT
ncbi:MFS transporter [Oricola sp.]|uniref:MFS transporter n=1 Tax=Oricola sp. TaxID=1979950 RepID=UPI0025F664B2|nr:MFS transporter [Oricola sp.]MCI5076563.1 MFS transporter [Oricola sp.]